MKWSMLSLAVLAGLAVSAYGQGASELKSAQPEQRAGETQEQHGRRLLGEMLTALGGDTWLNKRTSVREGQTAAFFRAEPTGTVTRFVEYREFEQGPLNLGPAPASKPAQVEESRVEFVSYKGLITPGTKRDLVHLWTADQGYEETYKGTTTLPEKQVADFIRRRAHSLEAVMRDWVNAPGTVVLYEGAGERDRRPVEKVSILAANNDAIEIEIEQGTHLPLQRSYRWRNEQFKDYDLEEEVYGDWRQFDGVMTPMNTEEYKNGDMIGQTFYKKVGFNETIDAALFNPATPLKK